MASSMMTTEEVERTRNLKISVQDDDVETKTWINEKKSHSWADVANGSNDTPRGELSFPEAGYMSQASSVCMEMDQDMLGVRQRRPNWTPLWSWVDYFEDGMVFVCTTGTFEEAHKRMLLGLPKQYMFNLKKLSPRTHIFLFNKTTKTMHAGYHPSAEADWNICPAAFTPIRKDKDGNEKRQPPGSKYPAQLPFKVYRTLASVPEDAFKGVLKDPRKPKRLKRAHMRQLLRIFQKHVDPQARPGSARADGASENAAPIRLVTEGSDRQDSPPAPVMQAPVILNGALPPTDYAMNLMPPTNGHMRRGSDLSSGSFPASVHSYEAPSATPRSMASLSGSQLSQEGSQPITLDFRQPAYQNKDSKLDTAQQFKMRASDSLKRLHTGNVRPATHLMSTMHDQITTLQAQLQQQQLVINNLTWQLSQVLRPTIIPMSGGGMSPNNGMSPPGNAIYQTVTPIQMVNGNHGHGRYNFYQHAPNGSVNGTPMFTRKYNA